MNTTDWVNGDREGDTGERALNGVTSCRILSALRVGGGSYEKHIPSTASRFSPKAHSWTFENAIHGALAKLVHAKAKVSMDLLSLDEIYLVYIYVLSLLLGCMFQGP